MPNSQPNFWRHLRAELSVGPRWADRVVVLAYAIVTGLVVVGFTLVAEWASRGHEQLLLFEPFGPWLALAWTPLVTFTNVGGATWITDTNAQLNSARFYRARTP